MFEKLRELAPEALAASVGYMVYSGLRFAMHSVIHHTGHIIASHFRRRPH